MRDFKVWNNFLKKNGLKLVWNPSWAAQIQVPQSFFIVFDAKTTRLFICTVCDFNCIQSRYFCKGCTSKGTISHTEKGFKLMLIGYWSEPIRIRLRVINLKAFLTHSVPGNNCIWLLLHAGAPEIIGIWSCSNTRPCLCITWLTFASWDVFNSLGAAVWIIFTFRLLLPSMVMKKAMDTVDRNRGRDLGLPNSPVRQGLFLNQS